MRPSCTYGYRERGECDHKGYVHAKSLEQVLRALPDDDVWDQDSDVVCGVTETSDGYEVSYCFDGNPEDIRTYDLADHDIDYILIPKEWAYDAVTDEELAEVYKILGVKEQEDG